MLASLWLAFVLLWTRYLLLLIVTIVAFVVLLSGDLASKTGASVLLWRALSSFRALTEQ